MVSKLDSLLQSTEMFSSLSTADRNVVLSLSELLTFQDGQAIFQTEDPSSLFFVVIEGEIIIRTGDSKTQQADIARFLAGDCFGELDFFTHEQRTANAIAVGPTQLLGFPKGNISLSDISTQWPIVSAHLLHVFLIHISKRIRGANALVKNNSPLVRELKRQAYVDKLTGLFNKTYFEETLRNALQKDSKMGILLYKPDNFKKINDNFGHEAGDVVLKFLAETLRKVVPNQELLFRYMGNEYAILLPEATRESLWETSKEIGEFLRKLDISPVLDGIDFYLSVSMGLALSPEHGNQAANLIDTAHSLVLEGRRRGGNFTLFPEDSDGL